jgi:hypothetical protein
MLTFLNSERAIDGLRWFTAFVAVVLAYGIAGWMLLRPTGWQLGVNAPVLEIDLRDLPQPSDASLSDHAPEPSAPVNPPGDNARNELGGSADTAPRAAAGSASRTDASDTGRDADAADAKDGSADAAAKTAALDKAENPAIMQPSLPADVAPQTLPLPPAYPPPHAGEGRQGADSGGGGVPTAAPPRSAATDTPIDTSIAVNQGRSLLRSAKAGPQAKGLPLLQLPPLKLALPTPNRNEPFTNFLTKRPSSIVGLTLPAPVVTAPAANQGRAQDLAQKPAIGADGEVMRNAVGAVIEQRAAVRRAQAAPGGHRLAGAPLGIHRLAGATAMHAPGEHGPTTTAVGMPLAAGHVIPTGASSAGAANQSQAGHHDRALEANHIASIGGPSVNGAGLSRPAFSTGALGGPAHAVAGALNGSNFRPKYP